MLTDSDLNAPAHLRYAPAGKPLADAANDWQAAHEYPSLREALHRAMNEEPPAGCGAYIRTASGSVLDPETLESLWSSLQGP